MLVGQVAFELYSPTLVPFDPTKTGISGAFLSVVGDCVQTLCPTTARTLLPGSADVSSMELTSVSDAPPAPALLQPDPSQAGSAGPIRPSASRRNSSSGQAVSDDVATNHGGKVVKRRTSASSLSKVPAGTTANGKKRTSSTDGTGTRPAVTKNKVAAPSQSGARWSIEIPESAVWTIVGVESVRHTFFVPGGERVGEPGVLAGPVTPLVSVSRYLPPGTKVVNDPHERGYQARYVNGTQEQMISI